MKVHAARAAYLVRHHTLAGFVPASAAIYYLDSEQHHRNFNEYAHDGS
jgi:hypothetical protein